VVPRTWIVPLCIALCALAGVFVVLGFVIYLVPASQLPGILGKHAHAPAFKRYKVPHVVGHPSHKRALIAFAVAALPLAGAWWLRYRYDPPD
jgi:hypothetical protein